MCAWPNTFFSFLTALHLATEQYLAAGSQDKPGRRSPGSAAPSTTQTQTPVSALGWGENTATYTTDTTWKLGVGEVLPGEDCVASGEKL